MIRNKKIKVCVLLSQTTFSLPIQWFVEKIDNKKFEVNFILLNKSKSILEDYLAEKKIKVTCVNYSSKINLIPAFLKVYFLLLINRPKIVHCHLFEATIIGLLSAKFLFI